MKVYGGVEDERSASRLIALPPVPTE
jgi:hypothetical protein